MTVSTRSRKVAVSLVRTQRNTTKNIFIKNHRFLAICRKQHHGELKVTSDFGSEVENVF